jgi:hypothetical protein
MPINNILYLLVVITHLFISKYILCRGNFYYTFRPAEAIGVFLKYDMMKNYY